MNCTTEELYKNFRSNLKGFINSKIHDDDISDDLVQEAFIKIYQHCHAGNGCDYPKSFLYKIVQNLTADYFRSSEWKRKKQTHTIDDERISEITDQQPNEDDTQGDRIYDCLIPLINTLEAPYREALELADLKNLSQKEIAAQLDISVTGANSRIQRGRSKLKDLLQRMCEIEHDCYGNIIHCEQRKNI